MRHPPSLLRPSGRARRVLLYDPAASGLGGLRRSLCIAEALVRLHSRLAVLLVTGSPRATLFDLPERVELVKLPSVARDALGAHRPRFPVSLQDVLEMRRATLAAAHRSFRPDTLLVDGLATGLYGEVLPLLRSARREGARALLGLPDVLGRPESVARDWAGDEEAWALEEGYERVLVHGAPEVFDPRRELPLQRGLVARLELTGYVTAPGRRPPGHPLPRSRPQVLFVGGGRRSEPLGRALDLLEDGRPEWDAVLCVGPLSSRAEVERIARRARGLARVELRDRRVDLRTELASCDAVVSTGGYEACAEALAAGRRAILLPRTGGTAQALRAGRLAALGVARSPGGTSAATLAAAIAAELADGPLGARRPPVDGALTVARILLEERERTRHGAEAVRA